MAIRGRIGPGRGECYVHIVDENRCCGISRTSLFPRNKCAHEPLQFYWFRAAIRFYNGMLSSNSATLKQTFHSDLKLVPRAKTYLALNILRTFEELRGCDTYTQASECCFSLPD